jgi:N-acetylglutamate synthase-like GNAT family acetyltransferase
LSLQIELLTKKHRCAEFSCGDDALDAYLQRTARQHIDKGISRTFVLTESEFPEAILVFMTLSVSEVVANELPDQFVKKYPNKIPAAKLAHLAVSTSMQRQGLGELMLVDAMQKTLLVAQNLGIAGLFVDAKHEQAKRYYSQFGFLSLPDKLDNLFLPIKTIASFLED